MLKQIELSATSENLIQAQAFLEETLEGTNLGVVSKLSIVLDEIFSNIANYSGAKDVIFAIERTDGSVSLIFSDNGKQFNPLKQIKKPDTTLSVQDRSIGGLGFFIVGKMTDSISYEYTDGRNILTVCKNL